MSKPTEKPNLDLPTFKEWAKFMGITIGTIVILFPTLIISISYAFDYIHDFDRKKSKEECVMYGDQVTLTEHYDKNLKMLDRKEDISKICLGKVIKKVYK